MTEVIHFVGTIVLVLGWAVFARAILSWFPIDRNGPIFGILDAITEPILDPLRRVIPPIGMIDITPMVAILLLFAIARILQSYQPA